MDKVGKLVEFLRKCDEAYYKDTELLVTNDTYDSLVNSLKKMDPTNNYLNKVGTKVSSNKVGRLVPMGTLEKLHEDNEVKSWLENHNGTVLLCPKYDGFGVELTYVNGKLVLASTRGDGHTGEDVTEAMKCVRYVPQELPEDFKNLTVVRGEAIIPKKYHEELKKLGYTAMRNAVPGIVRSNRKDALKYVEFVAYEFFDNIFERRSEQRSWYEVLFNIEDFLVLESYDFDNILHHRNLYGDNKDNYKYEIDGMVLKTDDIIEDDLLCPKHQVAWKFKSNRRETILREVVYQMGVTGTFNPVGIFDPVEFQGATLTRASLGSMARLNSMDIKIGSVVEVSRRGDIIPYIEDVVYTPEGSSDINELNYCPHCGSKIELIGESYKCVNPSCGEKLKLQIMYYVGTIGVKGIGQGLVRALVDSGKISKLPDVYKVTEEDIINLPRQGQSSADKWKAFINKELTPLEFLCAIPFDNIGKKAWESLLDKWTVSEIINLTYDDIINSGIKGLGEGKVKSLTSQMIYYKNDIEELYNLANIK